MEVRCLATVPSRTGLPAYVMVVSKYGRGGAEQEEDIGEDEGEACRRCCKLRYEFFEICP